MWRLEPGREEGLGGALRCCWRAWGEQKEDVGAAVRAFSRNLSGRGRASSAPSTVESARQLLMPQTLQCLPSALARADVWRWEVSEVLSAPAARFPWRAGAALLTAQRVLCGSSPGLQ